MRVCSLPGCERRHYGRGLCRTHYDRLRRNGTFAPKVVYMRGPAEDRFWPRIDKDGPVPQHAPELGPCWLWTAGRFKAGYGCMYADGRMVKAHRFAYELLVGPIPAGLELDHLCRNKPCARPSHLEPVTHDENVKRHFRAVAG